MLSLGVQEMPRGAGHSEEVLTMAEDLRASRGWLGTTPNGDASSALWTPASHSALSPREPYPSFLKGAGFSMQARLAPLPALNRTSTKDLTLFSSLQKGTRAPVDGPAHRGPRRDRDSLVVTAPGFWGCRFECSQAHCPSPPHGF